ncbi:MAG: hypothetical protein WEE89_12750 [Gemmatimonadota bacterium]
MRSFTGEHGQLWTADVLEEQTPRHHGRWYLVFRSGDQVLPMPEVRWQTRASAEHILKTISDFELQRRLKSVRARNASSDGASDLEGEGRGVSRASFNLAAG